MCISYYKNKTEGKSNKIDNLTREMLLVIYKTQVFLIF